MTKKLVLAAIFILSFTLVSCGKKADPDQPKPNNKPAVEENKKTSEDKKEDENTKTDDKKDKNETKNNQANNKVDSLSIYSIDENSLEPNKASDLNVDSTSSLNDKLQKVANTVSQNYFNNLPIKVKSIDTVNGKKVATINLTDSSNNLTWSDKFQGSTGGQMTTNTLLENFLQVSYKGEWVDGVKFLYNDAPIEYDHVYELSQVQYRN